MAWVVCSAASLWHANAQEENFDAVVNLSEAGKLYDEAPDNIWEETAVSVKITTYEFCVNSVAPMSTELRDLTPL